MTLSGNDMASLCLVSKLLQTLFFLLTAMTNIKRMASSKTGMVKPTIQAVLSLSENKFIKSVAATS